MKMNFEREACQEYEQGPDVLKHPAAEAGEMAAQIGERMRLAFRDAVRNSLAQGGYPQEFVDEVLKEEFDLPPVEVYDNPTEVQERLEALGFSDAAKSMEPDEALLVLRLPDQMRKKYRGEHVQHEEEWQSIYRSGIAAVWGAVSEASDDVGPNRIYRINQPNVHGNYRDLDYYYVYSVAPSERHGRYEYLSDDPRANRVQERMFGFKLSSDDVRHEGEVNAGVDEGDVV
jgi:hypothetical protein